MRVLDLSGSPADIGRGHGKELAADIHRYLSERLRLAADGSWTGRRRSRDEILGVAARTVGAHASYAPQVHAEVEGMAEASGVSVPELILLGGFTDMVDVLRLPSIEDDCTAVLVPESHADAAYLAQTWDMHDTAGPYIVMCRIQPEEGPAALVYTTAGCVGQMGMNEAGICVGINNLSAAEGRTGVTWPYVVRKVLAQTDLESALACVTDVELAGAHNYLLLDGGGRGYNVEAMPGKVVVDALEGEPLVHTNHCLHSSTRALEASRATSLAKSSLDRHDSAVDMTRLGGLDVDSLWAVLSDEAAICRRAEPPDHIESCGGVVMRPSTREMWASAGIPADTIPLRFAL